MHCSYIILLHGHASKGPESDPGPCTEKKSVYKFIVFAVVDFFIILYDY